MFCSWAKCGHVLLHHATRYIFFATAKDAADGKLETDIQMVLNILYNLISLSIFRTIASFLFVYLQVHV